MKHIRTTLAATAAALAATAMIAGPASAAGTGPRLFKVPSTGAFLTLDGLCNAAIANVTSQAEAFGAANKVKVVVIPETGNVNLTVGSGNHFVVALGGVNNVINTGSGNDYVCSSGGNDTVYLGSGNDEASGEGGNDAFYGESGNDRLLGQTGNDYLSGGSGNDTLLGGTEVDSFSGGTGNDETDKVDGENCTDSTGNDAPPSC